MSATPESPTWSCSGYEPGPTAGSVTCTSVALAVSTVPMLPPTLTEILPMKPVPEMVICVPPARADLTTDLTRLLSEPQMAS